MQHNSRINELFQRAKRAGVKPSEISAAAKVHVTTLYRWRSGETGPRVKQLDAMEQYLCKRERTLAAELTQGLGR